MSKQILSSGMLQIVDSIAIVLGQAYQLVRTRSASTASSNLRLIIERDHEYSELQLLRRELEILRGQRASMTPHRRPAYAPDQRLAIIQLMRLRGWSAKVVAKRFVLHPNTVRTWVAAIEGRKPSGVLFAQVPWNKIDDVVRWAVHELRRLFPEPEFGHRSIARHLVRAGIAISATTVRRVQFEDKPVRPRRPRPGMNAAVGAKVNNLLLPTEPNRVWHLDMLEHRVLWLRFTVAAVLDGCTRRLIRLKAFSGHSCTLTSDDMVHLIKQAAKTHGMPHFLITDHGSQFRIEFRKDIRDLGIRPVQGRVRSPMFNGKVERFFRTLRIWLRSSLLCLTVDGLQRRLDVYAEWYNARRPHQAINERTPEEVASRAVLPRPMYFRQRAAFKPSLSIRRLRYRGDPHLPVVQIDLQLDRAA